MEVLILAGGLGTRLRNVITDVPKPMASVCGRPFLAYLLEDLRRKGVDRAVISTCHMAETIRGCFGSNYRGIEIVYSHENEPLGTGGAIKLGLAKIQSSSCAILNGDTLFDVDLNAMERSHRESGAELTMALKPVINNSRYGSVMLEGDRIAGFRGKAAHSNGRTLINGGTYITGPELFCGEDLPAKFSFELDFLSNFSSTHFFQGFVSDGFFIDIGVPEDYFRAQSDSHIHSLQCPENL